MYPRADFLREKRFTWFGYVQRRATTKIFQIAGNGKRNRGRSNLRWRDMLKEDMARNQMTTNIQVAENIGVSLLEPLSGRTGERRYPPR